MITVRIQGGLGNQLFQYAFARELHDYYGFDVQLDKSAYLYPLAHTTPREYYLHQLPLAVLPTREYTFAMDVISKLRRKLKHTFLPFHLQEYIQEGSRPFYPKLFTCRPGTYLDGYWQSPHYFKNGASALRHEIMTCTLSNNSLLQQIKQTPGAVGVHVRRGDYVQNYAHIYNCLDQSYYSQALQKCLENSGEKNPVLFVFSDDIESCKTRMDWGTHKVVFVENGSAADDLIAMAHCRHHIIANSSFSWWAAWLGNTAQQVCIAPKHWFVKERTDFTEQLYLPTWLPL